MNIDKELKELMDIGLIKSMRYYDAIIELNYQRHEESLNFYLMVLEKIFTHNRQIILQNISYEKLDNLEDYSEEEYGIFYRIFVNFKSYLPLNSINKLIDNITINIRNIGVPHQLSYDLIDINDISIYYEIIQTKIKPY